MSKSFSLLLVILFISGNLFSSEKEFYIKDQAKWIETIKYEKETPQFKAKEDVTYLLLDNQNNVGLQEQFVHVAIKINEETGIQSNSDLWVDYDPSYQKLIFHKIVVHRQNLDYNRLVRDKFKIFQKESDLEHKIYSEKYTAGLYIEDVQVGDIIEFAYTIKGNNPVFKDHFFYNYGLEFSSPINKFFLKVLYPKSKALYYRLIESDLKPEKTTEGDNVVLKWQLSNLEEKVANTDLPSWYIAYGSVQFSTINNWEELTNWSLALYPKLDIKGSILEKKFNELTGKCVTESEKISELIRFVQEEIRYVGIEVNENSYKPHSPYDVFNKRYGDCKDKSYLLVTLLQHMGIKAYPSLVSTDLRQNILEYLPTPTIFNHVIVAIEFGNEIVFVDPTMTSQRGDFKHFYNGNYKKAFIIDKKFKEPVDINFQSTEKIVITETFEVKDTIAPVKYTVESTYYGSEADQMRSLFKMNSQKELESSYLDFYDLLYPTMRVIGEFEIHDNERDNIINVKEHYEIDNFWEFDDTPSINDYVCTIDAKNLKFYLSIPKQKNRVMPFLIYNPIEIENEIRFKLAQGINIKLEEGEINNTNFHFSYKISKHDGALVFNYKYKSLKDFASTSEMNQYYKDIDKITDIIWNRFTYGHEGVAGEKTLNWMMIILSAFFTIILVFIAFRLYKRDIGISLHDRIPLKIGGWLILPAIGLALSPFLIINATITTGYFDLPNWELISDPDSLAYNSLLAILFVAEILINNLLVVFSILLFILFIKRRTSFPILYITFLLINLTFTIADQYLITFIESEYYTPDPSAVGAIAKTIIAALIWIPYMLKSQRVKNTFVNNYNKDLAINSIKLTI